MERGLQALGLRRDVVANVANLWLLTQVIKHTDLLITLTKLLQYSALSGLKIYLWPAPIPPVPFDMVWHCRDAASFCRTWRQQLTTVVWAARSVKTTLPIGVVQQCRYYGHRIALLKQHPFGPLRRIF